MKLGLFFGAGAEISYGLPSGGSFAIDLFRQDTTQYKDNLRKELSKINSKSIYAAKWLPDEYVNKPIYAFGKNEFGTIIESSIQYKRDKIISRLNNFDSLFEQAIKSLDIDKTIIESKYYELTNNNIGDVLYTHNIKLNPILSNSVTLFDSIYYSGILEVIKNNKDCDDLRQYATAFLQLLVGAHGHELVKQLNEELFTNSPDNLPIFDDIFGMFRLEFNQVGAVALDLLLNHKKEFEIDENAELHCILTALAKKSLELIFIDVLDYQKLIDEHFRYLFAPKTEWAKFTKMAIFLEIARDYIKKKVPANIDGKDGYYNDLDTCKDNVIAIGTSNYNSLLSLIQPSLSEKITYLNGSVSDFYNPYKNNIVQFIDKPDDLEQLHFPFILTQSGLKPLTSVEMSRRYVNLYDSFKESDAIIVVGFRFNSDDGHINGLFRSLIEEHNKKIFIVGIDSERKIKQTAIGNLRIDKNISNIIPVAVDGETRKKDDSLWIDFIINTLQASGETND